MGDEMEPWRRLAMDMNLDERFTLSDVGLWLYHGFFLPGDYVLALVFSQAPQLERLLDLSPAYERALSGVVSGSFWLGAIIAAGLALEVLRNADRAATAHVRRLYLEALRRARVARIRAACRMRGLRG